jgi:hypothetical protein
MKAQKTNAQLAATLRGLAALPILAVAATQPGCGREFYREWANQDVSEVVFEKTRDPRFRIDMFSIDPPWMSRYADPYDPDRPPAPPDDLATQAMGPIPQTATNQLMVPLEGTGYLAMLEQFQADFPAPPPRTETIPPEPTAAPPPAPPTPSPFTPPPRGVAPAPVGALPIVPGGRDAPPVPRPNSGTSAREMSPILAPGRSTEPVSLSQRGPAPPRPAQSKPVPKDGNVRLAATQVPAPRQDPNAPKLPVVAPSPTNPAADPLQVPRLPGDPDPRDIQDLSKPVNTRPDLTPRQNQMAEAAISQFNILGTPIIDFNEAEAAGQPRDAKIYVISMAQAFTLALINARVYQTNLETVYRAALPVTLQRFAFTPQFIAGISPLTSVAQGPSSATSAALGSGLGLFENPANSFNYRTRATGLQQSNLNIGTVAGVGKNLDNGVKMLASFASQIVFNFTGKHPAQPAVQSFLPISVMAPFLRGGGRAVTLEALTQAERNMVYAVRNFVLFRQQFVVTTLAGGTNFANFGSTAATTGFSTGGNTDPTTGFINIVEDVALLENQTRNVATFEQFSRVYKELIKGESSGLTQLQLDQLDGQLTNARSTVVQSRTQYRNDLDAFKLQLGLPPDVVFVPDRRLTAGFRKVFEDIELWARDPKRELPELERIAARLPNLEDIDLDGRSCIGVFSAGNDDGLEDLMLAAERISFENRLDLMNNRAQLYDAWRQIRVSANALQGVFNVQLTNQYLTPPTTTNPFAFVDQAKQFSLVINAELPLVRMAERNNFRTALINYQQARRTLQFQEDFIKNQLRGDIRSLQTVYLQYQFTKRLFVINARQKDQSFENIVAPPAGATGGTAANASGATQTNNLIQAQGQLISAENNLITFWYNYQTARLSVYRDLGTLPYDEWEAFYAIFPSEFTGIGAGGTGFAAGPAAVDSRTTSGDPSGPPPTYGGRP